MRSILKFFLLAYFVSWSFWIAAAAISGWSASPPPELALVAGLLFLFGTITPSLVARHLTQQIFRWERSAAVSKRQP